MWLLLLIPFGVAVAGDHAGVEATEYSPYSDPGKPVLSFLLSDQENVASFREEFGLSGDEMEAVLAATREENERLAEEYAQSEQLVEANEEMSKERVEGKISASDYQEQVEAAVSETKITVEAVVAPESGGSALRDWADAGFAKERQEFSEEASVEDRARASGTRRLKCRVFATQYEGYTKYEAALPHRSLKFQGGFRINLRRGERNAEAPVKEVGPWNTYDNYWRTGSQRTMWRTLPRCKPEAQAAYFNNFNRGRDEFGRKVLNPAGVDLTPAVARKLGL
ncbi:MAG: hypothetical protein ACRDTR_14930, partial [Rubrobacter sp.]